VSTEAVAQAGAVLQKEKLLSTGDLSSLGWGGGLSSAGSLSTD
jgi:hypothetical protein